MKAEKTRDYIASFCDLKYTDALKESSKELTELERLAEIGKATEQAFEYDSEFWIYKGTVNEFKSVDDLLAWYRPCT